MDAVVTAIVGIAQDDDVWLGCDSEIVFTDSWARQGMSPLDCKVFRVGAGLLIGVTGSVRETQIVRYKLKVELPTLGRSVSEWMATDFADALRKAYADSGSRKVVDTGVEYARDAAMLVAVAGRLFSVYNDFSWCENPLNYEAIGSGGAAARGALHYMRRDTRALAPEQRIEQALACAADDNVGVRAPFYVERLRGEA